MKKQTRSIFVLMILFLVIHADSQAGTAGSSPFPNSMGKFFFVTNRSFPPAQPKQLNIYYDVSEELIDYYADDYVEIETKRFYIIFGGPLPVDANLTYSVSEQDNSPYYNYTEYQDFLPSGIWEYDLGTYDTYYAMGSYIAHIAVQVLSLEEAI